MDGVYYGVRRLSFKTFVTIFVRSFFSQGSWSPKYRQNMGFVFCMEPVGKELWTDFEDRKKFNMRHIEYYNGTQKKFFATKQYSQAAYFGNMKELLEEIKETLEK